MSDAPDQQRIDDFLASVANYEAWALYELNEAFERRLIHSASSASTA